MNQSESLAQSTNPTSPLVVVMDQSQQPTTIEGHVSVGYFPPHMIAQWQHQSHPLAHQNMYLPEPRSQRLSRPQHEHLEHMFKLNHKPPTSQKREIAEYFQVPLEKINNWFQNRRAKMKQENKKASNAANLAGQGSSSDGLNIVPSNGHLTSGEEVSNVKAEHSLPVCLPEGIFRPNFTFGPQQFAPVHVSHPDSGESYMPSSFPMTSGPMIPVWMNNHANGSDPHLGDMQPHGLSSGQTQEILYTMPTSTTNASTLSLPQGLTMEQPALTFSNQTGPFGTLDWPRDAANDLAEAASHEQLHHPSAQSVPSNDEPWLVIPSNTDAQDGVGHAMLPHDFSQHNASAPVLSTSAQSDPHNLGPLEEPRFPTSERRDSGTDSKLDVDAQSRAGDLGARRPTPRATIAARRQRPRPAALNSSALNIRSISYNSLGSPGALTAPADQSLRRIRSSVGAGRIQRGPNSASGPRSPMHFPASFTDFANNGGSSAGSSPSVPATATGLVPPTPMTPFQPSDLQAYWAQQATVSALGLDKLNVDGSSRTDLVDLQHFGSPPQTPLTYEGLQLQQIQLQQAQNSRFTPPQSAPPTQLCFPSSFMPGNMSLTPPTHPGDASRHHRRPSLPATALAEEGVMATQQMPPLSHDEMNNLVMNQFVDFTFLQNSAMGAADGSQPILKQPMPMLAQFAAPRPAFLVNDAASTGSTGAGTPPELSEGSRTYDNSHSGLSDTGP